MDGVILMLRLQWVVIVISLKKILGVSRISILGILLFALRGI